VWYPYQPELVVERTLMCLSLLKYCSILSNASFKGNGGRIFHLLKVAKTGKILNLLLPYKIVKSLARRYPDGDQITKRVSFVQLFIN
jgi:hypothetical protein